MEEEDRKLDVDLTRNSTIFKRGSTLAPVSTRSGKGGFNADD